MLVLCAHYMVYTVMRGVLVVIACSGGSVW